MKIVVLDGHTLNPGDNPWTPVELAAGDAEFIVYPKTNHEDLLQRAAGAEVLLTNKTVLNRSAIHSLPDLKLICVLATGVNAVDLEAAKEREIVVCNVPEYGTRSVAQFVFAQILHFCHHTALHDRRIREGAWADCGEFSFWETPQIELVGRTLGVIGFGAIGKAVAQLGNAFGMRVIAFSPRLKCDHQPAQARSLDEVLAQSDIISLHCPLNAESEHLICTSTLNRMKPGVFLINTARGGLICEKDLVASLESGHLAGAALDVCEAEPIPATSALLKAPNLILTPHMAWGTLEARKRLTATTAANLSAWADGAPIHSVL